MRKFDFKRYTPRPKKLLRASLTPLVSHSLMANTSSKRLILKFVGKALRSLLTFRLHSGYKMVPRLPLVLWIPLRHLRQKVCKHGKSFGSVNLHIHTEHDTSSWRLCNKVWISMMAETVALTRTPLKQFKCNTMRPCDLSHDIYTRLIMLTNHKTLFDMFWLLRKITKIFKISKNCVQ